MNEQSKAMELANQYESERLWDDVICSEWINSAASELRRLDAENAALRDKSEDISKLIKLCLQTAGAELIKQKGQINYLVRERDALRAQLAELETIKSLLPHKDCDSGCLYHCTEAGSHAPKCAQQAPEGYQLVPALAADWPLAVGVKRLLRELSLNAHPRDVVYFTLIDMLAAAKDGAA